MRRLARASLLALGFWAGACPGHAQSPDSRPAPAFTLRYSLKSSLLVSELPDAPLLFPDRRASTAFWRFRVEPALRITDTVGVETAVEQRWRVFSSASGPVGSGVLPSEAAAPYRLSQLDWSLASASHGEWRVEVDRAALHVRLSRANVTVGRQAIGWGRGVIFGAVDLFAPFTPLEADREWRRGVDGVRADVKLTDRVSFDSVGAFGDTVDRSAFATRIRGYAGHIDLEVMAGWRARDPCAGLASSAALGDIEVHGEVARFGRVTKAVAGGSYRFPFGHGLLAYVEYHYSGFGAPTPARMLRQFQDPAFQERYLRGDTQILGRHAVAVLASYESSPEVTLGGQWLQSPADGSGVVAPSVTFTPGDRWSFVLSGYVPYGRGPEGASFRSEFGAAPLAAFAQVRLYR